MDLEKMNEIAFKSMGKRNSIFKEKKDLFITMHSEWQSFLSILGNAYFQMKLAKMMLYM
ncbi:hypothetical protein FHS15_005202 [Paenibacillus castaneae]|uniref:hypothetical protein n=1 Tax=Paenibacillus castaneae TaxID=474957 RepID=UPI00141BACF5|nr:hypothetical protein [Paenibacillus castaneae]NIK80018.1 hypothetical protein [Paenibacillus castaneae]